MFCKAQDVVFHFGFTTSLHIWGPPWLLGPVSRQNSLNSFFSLYKNPIDLSLNPISSDSDEIGIQTQMFKMASRARITIL